MCFFGFYFWVKPRKNSASCASSSAGDSPQHRMLSQSSILPSVDLALSSSLQTDENIHRFQSPQGQIAISRTAWLLHVAAIEPQRQQSNYFCELCHQLGWLLLPSCEKHTLAATIIIGEDRRTKEKRLNVLRQAYTLCSRLVCLFEYVSSVCLYACVLTER